MSCDQWDKIFTVSGSNIEKHINYYKRTKELNMPLNCDSIPDDVKYWPAQGNKFFKQKYGWDLPDQPLANFWDMDVDGKYNPCAGDYPMIFLVSCDFPYHQGNKIPGEINYFIFNDNGGLQSISGPNAMQMEFQVNAFAYESSDQVNDMTFYEYKLIHQATEDLLDCYFSWWIDPDIGCYQDDYIGCDPDRNMVYVYNQDAVDGFPTGGCGGYNYFEEDNIPVLGFDFVKVPWVSKVFKRDEKGAFLRDSLGFKIMVDPPPFTGAQDTLIQGGLSSFIYMENGYVDGFPIATIDPQRGREIGFYNYLQGLWSDGTPMTAGGTGYNPWQSNVTKFAFPDDPNDPDGWSMCTANMPYGDRRIVMSTGPMLFQPGAVRHLTMAVFSSYYNPLPCPDLTHLRFVDDLAQEFMDYCDDEIMDGPNAPEMYGVGLDKKIILVLFNNKTSDNYNESYTEKLYYIQNPFDKEYRFEGYKIFQLKHGGVTRDQLDNPEVAREVFQTDLKNNVKNIYNWKPILNTDPTAENKYLWVPELKVSGKNEGLKYSFSFTEDQFATGDKSLVNGKEYHFMAIAYAHNNWYPFDPETQIGQKKPYLQGRSYLRLYTFRPNKKIKNFMPEAIVTRISGEGNPHVFLEVDDSMYDKSLSSEFDGKVTYKPGSGPVSAKIINPIKFKDKKYRLEISGNFNYLRNICKYDSLATWDLINITDNDILLKSKPLSYVKEYVVHELGWCLHMHHHPEPGTFYNATNGGIGQSLEYKDPKGIQWYSAVTDGGKVPGNIRYASLDFVTNHPKDPKRALSNLGNGYFVPFLSTKYLPDTSFYLSPAATYLMPVMTNGTLNSLRYRDLNNVDIVFTSDKSKWSKCIVVETANRLHTGAGYPSVGNSANFDMRNSPSIDQEGKELQDGSFGFSYFPGYAIDVETGKRLNIFFGENSIYSGIYKKLLDGDPEICKDLIFNPSSQIEAKTDKTPLKFVAGGQHYIYVTRQEYDGCRSLETNLRKGSLISKKIKSASAITWVSFPVLPDGVQMKSLKDGLIPNDVIIKLRVDNPYGQSRIYLTDWDRECLTTGDRPVYEFGFEIQRSEKRTITEVDNISVFPNPISRISGQTAFNLINLPENSTVLLTDIKGNIVRSYKSSDGLRSDYTGPGTTVTQFTINNPNTLYGQLYFIIIIDQEGKRHKAIQWMIW